MLVLQLLIYSIENEFDYIVLLPESIDPKMGTEFLVVGCGWADELTFKLR